jgi:hypothetical protein
MHQHHAPLRDRLQPTGYVGHHAGPARSEPGERQVPTELNPMLLTCGFTVDAPEPYSELAGQAMIICVRGGT